MPRRIGLAMLLVFTCSNDGIAQTANCLYDINGLSVAKITYNYQTSTGAGDPSQGSGVLISSKGHLITAAHVVTPPDGRTAISETVTVQLGSFAAKPSEAIVIRRDTDIDLALLKMPESAATNTPAPVGDSAKLTVGAPLTGLGFPLNSDLTIAPTEPITAKNTVVHGVLKPWWQTALALNPGDSGGPVFGRFGTVVGVAVDLLEGAQQISYVIPIQYAAEILSEAGVQVSRAGACADLPVCRVSSNGVEGYSIDQQIAGNSGWRGGGYNQTAYCNDRKTQLQAEYSNSILTESSRGEDNHRDLLGHVTYIYYCNFHRQESPVYRCAASVDCIDQSPTNLCVK